MGLAQEFKEFALKGSVLDLAVGIVLGAAFVAVVQSLVGDVIMPGVGLLLAGQDFSDLYWVLREGATPLAGGETLTQARDSGAVVVAYGAFLNTVVALLAVAATLFFLVKGINRARRPPEAPAGIPDLKTCPHCLSTIPLRASRCPHCTSSLDQEPPGA